MTNLQFSYCLIFSLYLYNIIRLQMLYCWEWSSKLLNMEDRIIVIATLKLIDNKLAELKAAVEKLQEHCATTEKGMLQYDWYVSEDMKTIKVLETYTNSEAVLFHFDNYKPFAASLSEAREFVSLEIYGNASDALTQRVKKINAQHFTAVALLNQLK